MAHRASWEAYRGPIPKGMWVLHKCDTMPCVNPDHLFLGTHQDNMTDKTRKGRNGCLSGSQIWCSNLSREQVRDIVLSYRGGIPTRLLMSKYSISSSAVYRILAGKTYKKETADLLLA
jgi:hypothetical protein